MLRDSDGGDSDGGDAGGAESGAEVQPPIHEARRRSGRRTRMDMGERSVEVQGSKREAGPVGSNSLIFFRTSRFAMLSRLLLLVGLATALVGCAAERNAARPDLALPTILDRTVERSDDGSLVLLDRLGEPRRVETEPIENRHVPGQIDTLRTLVFDGLAVEVYAVADGKELLQEIRVTGSGYETAEGLGVGSTRPAVREALGEPDRTDGDTVTYELLESPEDPTPTLLHIRYDGDRVAAMTWSYYVD
jgi:hypothetical protein